MCLYSIFFTLYLNLISVGAFKVIKHMHNQYSLMRTPVMRNITDRQPPRYEDLRNLPSQ